MQNGLSMQGYFQNKYPVLVQNSVLLQNVIENQTFRLCGQMFNVR